MYNISFKDRADHVVSFFNKYSLIPHCIATYGGIAIHEVCHAIAMLTLFTDVSPSIYINPLAPIPALGFIGGWCTWGGPAKQLTSIGEQLGKDYSKAAVAIAGPIGTFALGILLTLSGTKVANHLLSQFFHKTTANHLSLASLAHAKQEFTNISGYALLSLLLSIGDFVLCSQYLKMPRWIICATVIASATGWIKVTNHIASGYPTNNTANRKPS